MIAVDTNVLVYAHRREATEHPLAARLLRQLSADLSRWALPWPCLFEFASVVTNRRIWGERASTPAQAWDQIEAWCASPSVVLLSETPEFLDVLGPRVRRARIQGPLVHDARVAALCLAHGVETLLTRDRDFALFPELKTRDPFA